MNTATEMRELTIDELEQVNGGILAGVLGGLAFSIGFIAGYEGTSYLLRETGTLAGPLTRAP